MKGQYDEFDEEEEFQHAGLGAKKRGMSRNEQIYGDFYQAYQEEPQKPNKPTTKPVRFAKSAYSNFKSGSTIQNYAAECDVHIPQSKPQKKVKTIEQQEQEQQVQFGQFNLQSFLREYQQKQELQKIDEQSQEQQFNGPFCLHSKVKTTLNLVKIGEDDDGGFEQGEMNLNEMTFEQYQRLVMRNGKKEQVNKKRLTAEQREKQKEFIQGYGMGYKMLQKMGFNLSKGLGKQQKGISKPIQAVFKTAFTTKDSELRKQQQASKQQIQTQQQQIQAETALFQYRSRNIRINNFLLDLKNKFEAVSSKMFFYQKELQSYQRDGEISNSLRLQKNNQIEEYQEEITKLSAVWQYGKDSHAISCGKDKDKDKDKDYHHNQELNRLKNIHPRLALKYRLDSLFVKNQLLRLKSMPDTQLYEKFPDIARQTYKYLNTFYLQKQMQTIKSYQQGIKSFTDRNSKVWNLQEDVIDLVDEGPTEQESMATVSVEDQQNIVRMVELIAEKTVIGRIEELFLSYKQIGDVKNFKVLECLRVLKQMNQKSQIVQNIIKTRIKPLVLKYYEHFQIEEILTDKKNKHQKTQQSQQQQLPHLVIFPLFEIMDPTQMQLGKLLTKLSTKMWNLKSTTLYNILRPILQYCPNKQRQHFLNFYLAPRLLYQLEEFDLTQPHICKDLMASLKLYKDFFSTETLKELVNSTVIPEIVMTYRKYEQQGTRQEDLVEWTRRWAREVGKVVPQYLEEVLFNDFNISV